MTFRGPWRTESVAFGLLLSIGSVGCEQATSPDPASDTPLASAASPANPEDAAARSAASASWFLDETENRGIDFTHDSGARGRYRLPESFGAGCALFDADGDGDLDAYLVSGHDLDSTPDPATAVNRFFRNDGAGRFREDTEASGLGDVGYGYGVAVGDVDEDGDLDLYLANLGPDRLFLNEGDGTFVPAADERFANEDSFSVAPCFLDYDRDGDLDLFIVRYMDWSPDIEVECRNAQGGLDYCNPEVYSRGISDRLLRNDGQGRFTDVSEFAGVSGDRGNGLAAGSADLDGDGWPDVFVANDKTPDQLWINQQDGTFREEAVIRGCSAGLDGSPRAGMSVAFADLDRDGDLEIHVSNIQGEPDSLFQNNDGRFFDRAAGWGIAAPSRARTRWSAIFRDFDLDGRPELLVGCGRVMRPATLELSEDAYAEEDLFYTFGENGRFTTVADAWPSGLVPEATHGIATGDVDGDGFDDLLMVSRDGPARLLIRRPRPESPTPVRFDLRTAAGAPAIGATLRILREDPASKPEVHPIQTTIGYASTSSHVIPVRPPVASVQIDWADGTSSTHDGPFEAGRPVVLNHPAAD